MALLLEYKSFTTGVCMLKCLYKGQIIVFPHAVILLTILWSIYFSSIFPQNFSFGFLSFCYLRAKMSVIIAIYATSALRGMVCEKDHFL